MDSAEGTKVNPQGGQLDEIKEPLDLQVESLTSIFEMTYDDSTSEDISDSILYSYNPVGLHSSTGRRGRFRDTIIDLQSRVEESVEAPERVTVCLPAIASGNSGLEVALGEANFEQFSEMPLDPNRDGIWGEPSGTLSDTPNDANQRFNERGPKPTRFLDYPVPYPACVINNDLSVTPENMLDYEDIHMTIFFFARPQLRSFVEVRCDFPCERGPQVVSWFLTKENVLDCSIEVVPVTVESLQDGDGFIRELGGSFLKDAEDDLLRKLTLTFIPTGNMASNINADVNSPEVLQQFRGLFSQERQLTFLIYGRMVQAPVEVLLNAWERERGNLNAQWFPKGVIQFEWKNILEQDPNDRPRDQIQAMRVFYDFQEYYTYQGFGIAQLFEYEQQNTLALGSNRSLSVKALTIPGAGDRRYFLFLQLPQELRALRFSTGDALRLDFFYEEDLEDEEREARKWTAHVQGPLANTPEDHLTLIATRRWTPESGWIGDNLNNPLKPIRHEDHPRQNTIRDAISNAHSTPVMASMVVSDETAKQQLHALNTLRGSLDRDKRWIRDILTHGNYLEIPRVNVLHNVAEDTLKTLCVTNLSEDQVSFVNTLVNGSPGGICLGHGPPGTGKSFIMKQVIKALVDSGQKVLVCSSMNRTVNQLATSLGSMARSMKSSLERDLITVRLHMDDSEIAQFESGFPSGKSNLVRPPVVEITQPPPPQSFAGKLLHSSYNIEAQGKKDKPMENTELALFSWMKRFLGVMSDDLLETDRLDTWGALRKYYDLSSEGKPLKAKEQKEYVEHRRKLAQEIIRGADILVCTLSGAAAGWLRDFRRPDVILVDQAGKATEGELYPVFSFFPGARYILLGDHHQLPPRVMSPLDRNNMSAQMSLSAFERLQRNGFPSVMFREQYRMIPEIGDIVSDIFYGGKLTHAPSTLHRPLKEDICKYNEEKFGIHSPVVLINLKRSLEERQGASQSRMNLINIGFVLNLLEDLVFQKSVVAPELILSMTGYTAQAMQYARAVDKFADDHPDIRKVRFGKIDENQGEESEVVILDLTVQSSIGFMKVPNRLNVALSRARTALYIIGNDNVLGGKNSETECAYLQQLWDHCDENEYIFDTKETSDCKYVGNYV